MSFLHGATLGGMSYTCLVSLFLTSGGRDKVSTVTDLNYFQRGLIVSLNTYF